ncbi:MAG TPA: hypothetical protein VH880_01650 [Anaeromyxobacteraceae bacterium]|jgi:hypothetical protein
MRDPRLDPFRAPLAIFLAFVLLQAGSGALLFAAKLGLGAGELAAYYRGSEGLRGPRTLEGLLEVAVPHLAAIPLVLFVTLHLVAFAGTVRRRPFVLLAALSFGSALGGIAAAFGVRFLWPALAWAKIAAFVGLEASLAVWLGLLGLLFLPRGRAARASRDAGPPEAGGGPPAPLPVRGWAGPAAPGRAARPTPAPGYRR